MPHGGLKLQAAVAIYASGVSRIPAVSEATRAAESGRVG